VGSKNVVSIKNRFMRIAPEAVERRKIYLAYPFAEHDLDAIVKFHKHNGLAKPIEKRMAKSIIWQTLRGLYYLHRNWVMHRDIKPANILVMGENNREERGVMKIADFGSARIFQEPMRSLAEDGEVVTLWYRAPELLLGAKHYTKAVDIWSAGCILAELYLLTPIFQGRVEEMAAKKSSRDELSESEKSQLIKIFEVLGKPSEKEWPDIKNLKHYPKLESWKQPFQESLEKTMCNSQFFRNKEDQQHKTDCFDLLRRMLTFDPSKRISAKEALNHRFFQVRVPVETV